MKAMADRKEAEADPVLRSKAVDKEELLRVMDADGCQDCGNEGDYSGRTQRWERYKATIPQRAGIPHALPGPPQSSSPSDLETSTRLVGQNRKSTCTWPQKGESAMGVEVVEKGAGKTSINLAAWVARRASLRVRALWSSKATILIFSCWSGSVSFLLC